MTLGISGHRPRLERLPQRLERPTIGRLIDLLTASAGGSDRSKPIKRPVGRNPFLSARAIGAALPIEGEPAENAAQELGATRSAAPGFGPAEFLETGGPDNQTASALHLREPRYPAIPSPAKPAISIVQVDASGTAITADSLALSVPPDVKSMLPSTVSENGGRR
jgi:hypothetical protein